MLVANNLNTPGAGFAVDTNVVTVLKPGETTDEPIIEHWNKMSKQELAERILTELQRCAIPNPLNRKHRNHQPTSQEIASIQQS